MIKTEYIELRTQGNGELKDITEDVERHVRASEVSLGLAVVFVPGATGAVTTLEYEPGLIRDMLEALERLAPKDAEYAHNLRWGDGNGHSHVRAAMLGPSLSVPIVDGRLALGTWQQIVFIDLDNRPRNRRLMVQILGE
jgi:secondary thiamine-phosphate synthase enzyme